MTDTPKDHSLTSRRTAVKTLVAAALAPVAGAATLALPTAVQAATPPASPIRVIIPKSYSPNIGGKQARAYQAKLGRAVLDFVRDNYKGRTLPVWKRKYGTMDLEKRVMNICYWIVKSVEEHKGVHPVDPAWVAAQIMSESFFYEFAVSYALAVGICQFIPPTAQDFGMVTAGQKPEHSQPPYKNAQQALSVKRYYAIRGEWKKALRARRKIAGDEQQFLKASLTANLAGKPIANAQSYLDAAAKVEVLDKQVKDHRKTYRDYLQANFKGRSIFNKKDVAFFKTFDERVLYATPINAMVLMLAKHLRARNGNIIAAAAGYHSGLSNTRETGGIYERYGRIPSFEDTVSYTSRIFINHHEIVLRMG